MKEPYPGFTYVTDEQYKLIAKAGNLPKDRAKKLKLALEYEISHYRLSVEEYKESLSTKDMRKKLGAVVKHADELKKAVDSHHTIRAYLAGIALNDERFDNDWGDGRRLVDERIDGFLDIGLWARIALATGAGGREIWFPGGTSANPPMNIFISVLLNFWRGNLDRECKNWFSEEQDKDNMALFTAFAHACLDVSGHPGHSIGATKKRIERVLKRMNENEAAGGMWNFLSSRDN